MTLYTYKAKVTDVYDGDTMTCLVDLGFNINVEIKVRLAGIDTPELRGEEREAGLIVRDVVREMVLDQDIILQTEKDKTGKYGRYIGYILLENFMPDLLTEECAHPDGYLNLNEWLLHNNYAKAYGS